MTTQIRITVESGVVEVNGETVRDETIVELPAEIASDYGEATIETEEE